MKEQKQKPSRESKADEDQQMFEPIVGITVRKMAALKAYYNRVKKGMSQDQARKDLELSLEEIKAFDFSVFAKEG